VGVGEGGVDDGWGNASNYLAGSSSDSTFFRGSEERGICVVGRGDMVDEGRVFWASDVGTVRAVWTLRPSNLAFFLLL